jgi:hypothetical protein
VLITFYERFSKLISRYTHYCDGQTKSPFVLVHNEISILFVCLFVCLMVFYVRT